MIHLTLAAWMCLFAHAAALEVEPESSGATSAPMYTITQHISFVNLNAFFSKGEFLQLYKKSIATSVGVEESDITAQMDKIQVEVSMTLSDVVSDLQMLEEVIAEQAGPNVAASHVTVETKGAADFRRLAQSKFSVVILIPDATDVVVKAKQVQTNMLNTNALSEALSKRGVTATVQTTALSKVSLKAVFITSATLVAGNIDSSVRDSLGGSTSSISVDSEAFSANPTSTLAGTTTTNVTTTSALMAASNGAEDLGHFSVVFACAVFTVSWIAGSL